MSHAELCLLPSEIWNNMPFCGCACGAVHVVEDSLHRNCGPGSMEWPAILPSSRRESRTGPFKPVIYEFIQTCQIALSRRLSHLKILMATHLVWQTGKPNAILLSCS